MKLKKKSFDNLANKEQGELQKKAEGENQTQPKTEEDILKSSSCEHQDRMLGKENQTEPEENLENHGIMSLSYLQFPHITQNRRTNHSYFTYKYGKY